MARREYPGVYPYPAAGGRTLYRTLYTDSNGRQRQKRGFSSPSAAAKFRARMQVLGHSSITITERYYGHLEQSFADAAANETERAIWGAAA
jgi:integrase